MFYVAYVDPVGDTGDRLAQSVPREALVFGTAAITCGGGLEGAQTCRTLTHGRSVRTSNWGESCHCVGPLLLFLRLDLFALRLFEFNGSHACGELALTARLCKRDRRPSSSECLLVCAAVDSGERETWTASRGGPVWVEGRRELQLVSQSLETQDATRNESVHFPPL